VACDISIAVHGRTSCSAYHKAETCGVTPPLQDTLNERLRVSVLAGADGALDSVAGLEHAENIPSLSSSSARPGVSAMACAECVPRAPVCASAAASYAWSTATSSTWPTSAATPPIRGWRRNIRRGLPNAYVARCELGDPASLRQWSVSSRRG
jgi:hypothetical protein